MHTEALFAPLAGVDLDDVQIYVVGGAVRDRLLGKTPHDMDYVAVGIDAKTLLDRGFQPVGADFPVFLHPLSHVEVALARTERKVGSGHTGFVVHADPSVRLEEDLSRRDFTINAMAIGRDGQLIDPYNGQADLAQRTLRHVSPAFQEDPLRVLRGVRFLAQLAEYGLTLAEGTQVLMRSMEQSLKELSPERVVAEIDRILDTENPLAGLRWLTPLGVTAALAPELERLPEAFCAKTREGRLTEWVLTNEATVECIQAVTARFKTSQFRKQLLSAALRLRAVHFSEPRTLLEVMQALGWLRGSAPDEALDAALADIDRGGWFPLPINQWLHARSSVRSITAAHPALQGLSGAALGEAIYAERLKVLCTEISAPGTAPGL